MEEPLLITHGIILNFQATPWKISGVLGINYELFLSWLDDIAIV